MSSPYLTARYNAKILTVDYVAADGSHLLRTGGTIAWRFNNPGNLRPAKAGKAIYGAIAVGKTVSNGEFLIFASYEDGRTQQKALLRRKYNERTLYTMLAGVDNGNGKRTGGYSPESDNNDPQEYAEIISAKTGLPTTTKLCDLNDVQLNNVLDVMESHEGYHGQKATRTEKVVNTTSITLSDGAAPKSQVPVKLQVAGHTLLTSTNKQGQLPLISHLEVGKRVDVFLQTVNGQWDKAFDFVMNQQSKAYVVTNEAQAYSAPTDLKKADKPVTPVSRKSFRHIIQPGETLAKLAKYNKTTVGAIMRDNPHIKEAGRIYPSQVINIPGSHGSAPMREDNRRANPKNSTPERIIQTQGVGITGITRSKDGTGEPLALVTTSSKRAPWMEVAISEAKQWRGMDEDAITKTDNYHELTGAWFKTLVGTENAWCASFVSYCLTHCAIPYAKWRNSYRARAVALDTTNFVEINMPVYGCIVLLGNHHVAFVYAKWGDQYVCLGGNQDQQINFSPLGKKLRFFVPVAYYEFAKKDIALGTTLGVHNPDDLNKAFGILIKPKKKKKTETR